MATEKVERRDEWFEASHDPYGAVVGAANHAQDSSVYLSIQRGRNGCGVSLTLDEAEQLAEMLRLSARGLRGESVTDCHVKEVEQECNKLHKLLQDILATRPYDMVKAELEDEFRWALEAADTYMEQS